MDSRPKGLSSIPTSHAELSGKPIIPTMHMLVPDGMEKKYAILLHTCCKAVKKTLNS